MMDIDKNILNEDNPIWIDMSESEFNDYLINASDELDVEKLLLARMTSKNKEIADWAARRLYLAYVFGSFRIGDENVCMGYVNLQCKYPDFDKIKALTPKVILDDDDLNNVLYWSQYYKYDIMALEAALIAMGNNAIAKTILYFLYRDGKYIDLIYSVDVVITAPELNTKEKYDAFIAENAGFVKEYNLEERKSGEIYDQLEEIFELDDEPTFSYWVEEVGISNFALMELYLFGKYSGPLCLESDDVYTLIYPEEKNLEKAIALICEYINFYTTDYEKHYLCEGTACLDERLNCIIEDMRELNFSEEEQLQFAYAWFRGIESQGKISLTLMAVYLSGRFQYKGNTQNEGTDILLPELKSFGKALSIIPAYIEYAVRYSDATWDDGVGINLGRMLDKYLLSTMQEAGYAEKEIDVFRKVFLDEIEKKGLSDYFVCDADKESADENVIKVVDFSDMPF